jgi:hypothetical protein
MKEDGIFLRYNAEIVQSFLIRRRTKMKQSLWQRFKAARPSSGKTQVCEQVRRTGDYISQLDVRPSQCNIPLVQ